MPQLTTIASIEAGGWSFEVLAGDGNLEGFTEEMLEEMRFGALERMGRAQDFVVSEVKKTLSKVYPLIRSASSRRGGVADPMVRALRMVRSKRDRDVRQPAPPGMPPGRIMGDLQNSWRKGTRTWSKNKTVLTGRVRSVLGVVGKKGVVSLAGMMEFGAIRALNMRPHPFYRPTLARIEAPLGALIEGSGVEEERMSA